MDILFELFHLPPGEGMPWLGFNLILLKRLLESGFMGVHELPSYSSIGDIRTTPDLIYITERGRSFVQELGLHEL
jgi:hypothetical protein